MFIVSFIDDAGESSVKTFITQFQVKVYLFKHSDFVVSAIYEGESCNVSDFKMSDKDRMDLEIDEIQREMDERINEVKKKYQIVDADNTHYYDVDDAKWYAHPVSEKNAPETTKEQYERVTRQPVTDRELDKLQPNKTGRSSRRSKRSVEEILNESDRKRFK